MNKKMVFRTAGRIAQIISIFLLIPAVVAVIYSEIKQLFAFCVTALCAFLVGLAIVKFTKTKNRVIYAKDGFAITALAWIIMAVVGAVPFVITGEIPSYVDAIFETVSGFTTTGASILTDVESMSKSMLFWRSFTHWIGGMGVLVFLLAIIPLSGGSHINLMRAESPGPSVGKLVPKIRYTARLLYIIYIVLTLIELVLLLIGRMPLLDAICTSF